MNSPFFSVIVPVYNVEKYLPECIESVLNQSFGDFELILVDDGTKDNSGVICDEYAQKDARVKVIHQDNAGQAVARNTGTDIAQGEYIIYLDSDDYICDSDFLSKLAEKTKNRLFGDLLPCLTDSKQSTSAKRRLSRLNAVR